MPSPIILDPANRLLNGATSDFSLFGGQPVLSLGIGRADDLPVGRVITPASVRESDTAAAASVAPSGHGPASSFGPIGGDLAIGSDHIGLSAPMPSVTRPTTDSSDVAPAPGVPGPAGAGSATPFTSLGQTHSVRPEAARDVGHANDVGAFGGISAVSPLAIPVIDVIAHRTADTFDLVPASLTHAQAVIEATGDAVGDVTTSLNGTIAHAVDGVGDVSATLDHALDTADDAISAVALPTVNALAAADDAIGPVTGHVSDVFAGSDPVGGIETLTGMVRDAEVFHVGDMARPDLITGDTGSIVDDLAHGEDDASHDGLLGTLDHHDDAIGFHDLGLHGL